MVTRSERHPNAFELVSDTKLKSIEICYLQQYWDRFGSKDFMAFKAQDLPQSVLQNVYIQQKQKFLNSCEQIYVSKVLKNANVIETVCTILRFRTMGKCIAKHELLHMEMVLMRKIISELNRSCVSFSAFICRCEYVLSGDVIELRWT